MDVGLVCDACSALTPIGVPQCTRCGAAVALDPRPRVKSKPPPLSDGTVACGKCGMKVGSNQRFCPNCGARIALVGPWQLAQCFWNRAPASCPDASETPASAAKTAFIHSIAPV